MLLSLVRLSTNTGVWGNRVGGKLSTFIGSNGDRTRSLGAPGADGTELGAGIGAPKRGCGGEVGAACCKGEGCKGEGCKGAGGCE